MNAVVATQEHAAGQLMPASPAEAHYLLRRRQAVDYSKSTLVPKEYQGNPPNVMIAMEIAERIGASDLMVMQNLYIVHGRPAWSATFLIASVNASKRFTPLRFEKQGDDPAASNYRVRAYANDIKTGELCQGAWITWAMVNGEKWGPKWKTMPEQMFMYRAASFWTRTYASEVAMGIHTREEVEDILGTATVVPKGVATEHGNLRALEAQLTGKPEPVDDQQMDPEPHILTESEMLARFEAAPDLDALDDAYNDVSLFEAPEVREALTVAYNARRDALELR